MRYFEIDFIYLFFHNFNVITSDIPFRKGHAQFTIIGNTSIYNLIYNVENIL